MEKDRLGKHTSLRGGNEVYDVAIYNVDCHATLAMTKNKGKTNE